MVSKSWDLAGGEVSLFVKGAKLPGAIATAIDGKLHYQAGSQGGSETISYILQNADDHVSSSKLYINVDPDTGSTPVPPVIEPDDDDENDIVNPIIDRSSELPQPTKIIEVSSDDELEAELKKAAPLERT